MKRSLPFLLTWTLTGSFCLPWLFTSFEVQAKEKEEKETSALEAFKNQHGKVIELVKKKADDKKLTKEVDRLINYEKLAVAALGGPNRYKNRCEPRCEQFQQLLSRLIRENYLKRIRTNLEYELRYLGEEKQLNGTLVKTLIVVNQNGETSEVEVNYLLSLEDGVWQVFDIITDRVSLRKTYKYEFNKAFNPGGGGIDELIGKLERKLATLAQKE